MTDLRRFARIDGMAFKIVRLPPRDVPGGLSAVLDREQRVVFTRDDLDHPGLQLAVLDACRARAAQDPPTGGKGAA